MWMEDLPRYALDDECVPLARCLSKFVWIHLCTDRLHPWSNLDDLRKRCRNASSFTGSLFNRSMGLYCERLQLAFLWDRHQHIRMPEKWDRVFRSGYFIDTPVEYVETVKSSTGGVQNQSSYSRDDQHGRIHIRTWLPLCNTRRLSHRRTFPRKSSDHRTTNETTNKTTVLSV